MPSVGQNSFRRFVSRTSRPATVIVTLSVSVGIRTPGTLATSAFFCALERAPYVVVGHRFSGATTQNPLDRRQLRRTFTVARGAGDGGVVELDACQHAAQHQAAAAHVAAADERRRKDEAVTEDWLQDLDVFSGCN